MQNVPESGKALGRPALLWIEKQGSRRTFTLAATAVREGVARRDRHGPLPWPNADSTLDPGPPSDRL